MLVFFVLYEQLENHLLQPLVFARTVKLNPLTVIVAVLIGVELLGILGALLAIPVASMIQVILRDVWDHRRGRPKEEPTVGVDQEPGTRDRRPACHLRGRASSEPPGPRVPGEPGRGAGPLLCRSRAITDPMRPPQPIAVCSVGGRSRRPRRTAIASAPVSGPSEPAARLVARGRACGTSDGLARTGKAERSGLPTAACEFTARLSERYLTPVSPTTQDWTLASQTIATARTRNGSFDGEAVQARKPCTPGMVGNDPPGGRDRRGGPPRGSRVREQAQRERGLREQQGPDRRRHLPAADR